MNDDLPIDQPQCRATDHPVRRILIVVSGLTPQVVTETLFVLMTQPSPWLPDEIHVLTTGVGARKVLGALLPEGDGWLGRLYREYGYPVPPADGLRLHRITDHQGQVLDDIRSAEDNDRAADAIIALVRELSEDPHVELHVSIAGGRKSMGFYMGYALSLYGRFHDRMSHVLVSEPYETVADFFYPSRESRFFTTSDGTQIDGRDAVVTLANIPFVRLREQLPEALYTDSTSFTRVVAQAQQSLRPLSIVIDTKSRTVVAGGEHIRLAPFEMALYAWLAERTKAGQPGVHWTDDDFKEQFLKRYGRIVPPASAEYERVERSFRRLDKESIDPHKSKINKQLKEALGRTWSTPYQIRQLGPIPGTRYRRFGIDLAPEYIEFE